MLSDYERRREENIRRNSLMLLKLGITSLIEEQKATATAKKQRQNANKKAFRTISVARRQSARVKHNPPVDYKDDTIRPIEDKNENAAQQKLHEDLANGYRTCEGRWRGEMWGAVAGVPPGTCFGRGDFQRKGRYEMSETGFFKPIVDPEWKDSNKRGCYAIILNNDNSTSGSEDRGDTVLYAGSGGRHRGQNRAAPQVCPIVWESALGLCAVCICRALCAVRVA
jgi:hypothetical protein